MWRELFLALLAAAAGAKAAPYTVSGISSGGFMAVQHHIAYNADVVGAGALAAGPYWCAQDKLPWALSACGTTPALIDVGELLAITVATAATGTIDPVENIRGDRVWLFSGTKDTKVDPEVVAKAGEYYRGLGVRGKDLVFRNDVPAAHAMVTDTFGKNCSYFGSPYIDNCGFDAAGALLTHLLGALNPRVPALPHNIVPFSQQHASALSTDEFSVAGLAETGYAYVPTVCGSPQNKTNGAGTPSSCRVHVAYHGCYQGLENINTTFVEHAGYNEWAEANDIVVVYFQAKSDPVLNPECCWDWWGWTGPAYASKVGVQLNAIGRMMEYWLPG